MAKAFATVEKIVKVKSATITFNEDELMTLLVILNRIGGHPNQSYRKHTQAIDNAIYEALGDNINHEKFNEINSSVSESARAIYFEDME